ncbi:MAG: phosphatidylglycerophosphatase A [Pseudomonadota bacterium]
MKREPICTRCVAKGRWAVFLATGFGVGTVPVAPGTVGTLLAVPIYLLLSTANLLLYLEILVVLLVVGLVVCHTASAILGDDHPAIVWDEIVGFLITMAAAPAHWVWLVAGFLLFRLFDIWKPFPIRQVQDRLHGGPGTMFDDVLAGVYAWLCLQGLILLSVRFDWTLPGG